MKILNETTSKFNRYQSPLVRVSRRAPCPVCGKPDYCGVRADGTACICMRKFSARPTRNGGYLHIFDDSPLIRLPRPPVPKPNTDAPRADGERLSVVYESFLNHLVLANEHRANLRERGLSDSAIITHGYRSAPTTIFAANVARALARDHDLKHVPGFYQNGDKWSMNFGEWNQGIIVPVRNTHERIVGLMIRRDEANAKPKYVWVSSKDKPSGASPGSPPHFANVKVARATGEMLVSEGALKSSVISELTGQAVCGVAGVTNFTETFGSDLRRALPELRRVVVAYDADFRTNVAVRRGLDRIKGNLSAAGLDVLTRIWDKQAGKGLDDVLVGTGGVR